MPALFAESNKIHDDETRVTLDKPIFYTDAEGARDVTRTVTIREYSPQAVAVYPGADCDGEQLASGTADTPTNLLLRNIPSVGDTVVTNSDGDVVTVASSLHQAIDCHASIELHDDPAKFCLALRCDHCGEVICDVEANDTFTGLLDTAAGHLADNEALVFAEACE